MNTVLYIFCIVIDLSINRLRTENRLRSQRIPTPYKIKVNNCKLIDLVIILEQFNATILNCFEKFDHPFSHVFLLSNVYPESHGFVAMPVTSYIKDNVPH